MRAGRLLRWGLPIGADDPEGITHVTGQTFILSDEGRQRMDWIEITPATTEIRLDGVPHMTLNLGSFDNMGFEGVSWDQTRSELLIAQEMWPMRVLRIKGLAEARDGRGLMLDISEWRPDHWAGHMLADLSSLSAHDATGNLVLLSDLTSALVEYSPAGAPISIMPLWAGWHGLEDDLPQAEGIAIGPDGDIFIVSEPNLFFRFRRSEDAAWMRR